MMNKQLDEMNEVERQEYFERKIAYADFRRKELKEDALIRSMEHYDSSDAVTGCGDK